VTDKTDYQGLLYGLLAFGLWGFGPIYFKAVAGVAPSEVLSHRIVWSVAFLLLLLGLSGRLSGMKVLLEQRGRLAWLFTTALLISVNWLTFIWAIANDRMIDASLGYFINPLFTVLLALLFLHERLRRVQVIAIMLACTGVIYQVYTRGALPWVSLTLMGTFGFYGLIRKRIAVDPVQGLTVETLLMLPFALGYLLWLEGQGAASFFHVSQRLDILLLLAGIVTALPLVLFAASANRISLTLLGILHYIAPSMTFLLAVLVYDEPFARQQLISFLFIWSAIVLFTIEGWHQQRRWRSRQVPLP
jgi:chloramphenicol-sensitive protein RarD